MEENLLPLAEGFFTGAGLIVAIGAQNAFVLKQGLQKQHLFATALFCTLSDSLLIAMGVGGLGELLTSSPLLLNISKWGGAAFLFWYGLRSFRSIFRSESLQARDAAEPAHHSLQKTLVALTVFTFLNPHVYLDTIVLLGSIGSQFEVDQRLFFALGAMLSSFLWFFGLAYGAQLLAPLLKSKNSWKVVDLIIGFIMWTIAASLLMASH